MSFRVYLTVDGEVVGVVSRDVEAGDVRRDERLGVLFDAHHARLYRLARRLVARADDARDVVQETFLRAARAPLAVPYGATSEEAWLVRVMVNVARDGWRRRAVRQHHEARYPTEPVGGPGGQDAEAALVASQTVWRALGQLAPRRRAVVVLYEIEGVEVRDIGVLLGISAVTVRWHLSRGRKEMAEFIGRRV
jgi:RNA polymerase sigma factor (sigma-70 family)